MKVVIGEKVRNQYICSIELQTLRLTSSMPIISVKHEQQ